MIYRSWKLVTPPYLEISDVALLLSLLVLPILCGRKETD